MTTNTIELIQHAFNNTVQTLFSLTPEQLAACSMTLNTDESKPQFGDLNANAPMILARQLKKAPAVLAQQVMAAFSHPLVAKVELAGAGFLNLFLTPEAIKQLGTELIAQSELFFRLPAEQCHGTYNIEFVSANPTGPLHLGHGRGGIVGDVLGNILRFIGHQVTKEFYINDAGVQIQKLGNSLKIRVLQALGQPAELPEDAYHGTYLVTLAQECITEHGQSVVTKSDEFFQDYGKKAMLAAIKQTLADYGILFDVWFSEKTLHTDGSIDATLAILTQRGYLYEHEGALWLKSTAFGDDKDRVMRKSTGELTYAAADAAYFANKVERGFTNLIFVLGHDHHSYAQRLDSIRQALGYNNINLAVILYQLVSMKASGQLVRMSKRAGNIVTLKDVIEVVGKDVARFFYLNRKADAQLEFDLDVALAQTDENPVYYTQYAYVRTNSILAKAAQIPELTGIGLADAVFIEEDAGLLLKKIASLKTLLAGISQNHQTHLLTYYLLELTTLFHRYYTLHRIIDQTAISRSRGRLLVVTLVRNTFATIFDLIHISKPVSM